MFQDMQDLSSHMLTQQSLPPSLVPTDGSPTDDVSVFPNDINTADINTDAHNDFNSSVDGSGHQWLNSDVTAYQKQVAYNALTLFRQYWMNLDGTSRSSSNLLRISHVSVSL